MSCRICLPFIELTECIHVVIFLFTDGAMKEHFGKVYLEAPPLSTVVKLLCLQHVTEIRCEHIQDCKVSFSVRCAGNSCLKTLISTYGR